MSFWATLQPLSNVILSEDAPRDPHASRNGVERRAAGSRRASESKDPAVAPPSTAARTFLTNMLRRSALAVLIIALFTPVSAADFPRVDLNSSNAGPHEMQDTTRVSIAKAYARAWDVMAQSLRTNSAAQLDSAFIGTARENLAQRIAGQRKSGLTTRLVDRGHKVDVLFYSPEGMSMQLRDTAQVEVQVLEGDHVVHSDTATRHYLVIMTPTEVTWKVRVMQETP